MIPPGRRLVLYGRCDDRAGQSLRLMLMTEQDVRVVEVLLVEDSPSDTQLTLAAFEDAKMRNHVCTVEDGVQAMEFLRRQGPYAQAPRPDLILLDLNLPRKDGREVLAEIKADESLRTIPVAVMTASHAERDLERSSRLQANYYVTKPVDFVQFLEVVRRIDSFWVMVVRLPSATQPVPTVPVVRRG
jgi:CheY-like chemotaxis protein